MRRKLMKIRILACTLAFILAFVNCDLGEAFAAGSNKNNDKNSTTQAKTEKKQKSNSKTDIIVKYKDASKRAKTIDGVQSESGADKLDQKNYFKNQKMGVYEISETDDLDAVIDEFNDNPNVEYAQPNYKLKTHSVPTDDKYANQWALFNDGQSVNGTAGRANVDINAQNAWNLTMGSRNVVIGVMDTGIDISHKDLASNIFINSGEIEGNGIDDDGNGYIDDVNGWDFYNGNASVYDSSTADTHGTYVAGVIAATANNGGIAGVAPNVKILPLKFMNGTMGYTSDAIEAIEYAKNMGVTVMNCSFGNTDNNKALEEAMNDSGMLFICSAGNGGKDTSTTNINPAGFDIDNVISVASIDSNGVLAAFSNYGSNVDVAAPGTNILSTVPGNTYDYYSGTSVSAAIVSGIAALIQSYLPEDGIAEIKKRIVNNVTPCTCLSGKVASEGRVDAFAALSGTVQSEDDYTGAGNSDDILPADGSTDSGTWYTMDERASIIERFHYGEGGISPASGNYSVSCTDMSVTTPGFQLNISRSYNSRNQRQTLLGRGWTFGFEGKETSKDDYVELSLPDGSSEAFHKNDAGKYVGEGTRASFVKGVSGYDVLTTTDQYKYGFDSSTLLLSYMEDKNGNRISLTYDNGKLVKITDAVGRSYTLSYNSISLLSGVTDPSGRRVTYEYNFDNLLAKVTDPQGGSLTYTYDSAGYLIKLIDQNGHTFQQLTYSHEYGDTQNKVISSTDAAGETWNYNYNVTDHSTTITNNDNKKWTYWFDVASFTTQVQDPEGKSTYTEYYTQDCNTYYGDVKTKIDRNGNRTSYEVDLTTGNVTKVTNPDGGVKSSKYDKWNNVTEEVNESGSRTFYIYDSDGMNLLKKAQPLNGTSDYVAGNTTDFAVTSYTYYTQSEANTLFGCNAAGLKKTETDPEGNTTTYTYDKYGDVASVKDASGNITTYTYDTIGQKLSETTPKGNKTQWVYDENGQNIKIIYPDGGIKRTTYDTAGYKLLETEPNQYDETKDNSTTGVYTGTVGTTYEWYDNGCQKAVTDAEGNRTSYTWDIFGNKQTETKPNGSIYRYVYDSMNRLIKTYFKSSSSASEVLLNEVSYSILTNGNLQTTTTQYASDSKTSTTVQVTDYANRVVMEQKGDYSRTSTEYNLDGTIKQTTAANGAITYYSYDALGRQTGKWSPVSIVSGTTMYSWTGDTYDKAGNVTAEKTGKSLVALNATADDTYIKYNTYSKGLLTQSTDSDGGKTANTYDGDGRIKQTSETVSSSEIQITTYNYDYRGNVTSTTKSVRKGDIAGNSYSDSDSMDVVSTSGYDLNGNMSISTDAAGNVTSYTYDNLNRVLKTTKQLINSDGTKTNVTTSQTYTWDGKTAAETDAKGNVTKYSYDAMGNQTKITDALGNVTLKYYDRMGNNTAIVSPKNYVEGEALSNMEHTEFTYDAVGRVLKQTEVYQKMNLDDNYKWTKEWVSIAAKTYQYDALGNVISTTDALGNTTESEYNLAGQLESTTDAETKAQGLSYTVKYSYNGLGQKVKESYQGAVYNYTYDGSGNLLQTSINGTVKTITSYDGLGRAVSITDGKGNITTQNWNALGKVSQTITPGDSTIASNKTVYQYDVLGNLVYTKDSMGTVTTYTYDSLGRNLSKTVSDAADETKITTSSTYDLNGNELANTDGNGNTTTSTYDALNKVLSKTNALNQKTSYTYDADGNKLTEMDYLGNTTTKVYDGINRLVEERDANNKIKQQILYNDADAQSSSYDALHNRIQYLYDKNLRQTGTIDGEGYITSSTYDSRGNVKTKTDANGNTTTYKYDGENHLISVTDALGNVTSYTYDTAGNQASQTDGNDNTTTYKYNAANLITSKIDPNGSGVAGRTESYTYYANGLKATKTDRNGVTTSYTYDVLGKLTKEDAGGEVQSYTYDANGNLLTMTDATGTTTRTYDSLNRNTSKTVPDIGKSTYEYDLTADTAGYYSERTTDPKGNVTLSTYDKDGRQASVKVGDETTAYEYYDNGSRSKVIYPDNTTESYTYDKKNQVINLINKKSDGTVISSYQYTYDGAGNQLTKTEEKGTTTYTYDNVNRLSTVSEPGGKTTSYTYDAAGNRKTEKVQEGLVYGETIYNYNSQNRLISTTSTDGSNIRYTYDYNGNLVSKTAGIIKPISTDNLTAEDLPDFNLIIKHGSDNGTGSGSLTRYTYDQYNRLSRMKSDSTTATYQYNAQGYRVEKSVNGKDTKYLYNADKVVLETDASGNQTAFQAYGSSLLYRSVSADTDHSAQSYYYLYNAHGDVTSLIDTAGSIAATYDYDAFGNLLSKTGSADNYIRFAGYQQDDESGLYYLNARYYDSVTARFITEDTYYGGQNDPLSLNLYTYCSNNPIKYTDPTGHVIYITGTESEKIKILANLQMLTDYKLAYDDSGKVYIAQYPDEDQIKYPNGNELISQVIESKKVCTIQFSNQLSYTMPEKGRGAYNGKGCNVDIYLYPGYQTTLTVVPGKGFLTLTQSPLYITLGHELIHAYRDMNGVALDNVLKDRVTYTIAKKYNILGIHWYGKPQTHEYIVPWEEEATIGLDHNEEGDITENDLRAEHGLPMRGSWNIPEGYIKTTYKVNAYKTVKAIWKPSIEPICMQTLEIRNPNMNNNKYELKRTIFHLSKKGNKG